MIEGNVKELQRLIPRGLKKEQKEELASAEKVLAWLQAGKEVRNGMEEWTLKDTDFLNERQLLSAKPVVYLVNLSPEDYARKKNKWLKKIADWVEAHGGGRIIPFSAALEFTLQEQPADERAAFLAANPGSESALPKIIKTGFTAIQLIYFFTAGSDEVKCWTLRRGMKAPQAAGTIHTDFEKGFICAEVMAFEELREAGSEAEVKAKGRYRQEGKLYVVADGDVMLFKARAARCPGLAGRRPSRRPSQRLMLRPLPVWQDVRGGGGAWTQGAVLKTRWHTSQSPAQPPAARPAPASPLAQAAARPNRCRKQPGREKERQLAVLRGHPPPPAARRPWRQPA